MKRSDRDVREIFDQSFPVPSPEQAESTCARVLDRLNVGVEFSSNEPLSTANLGRPRRTWLTPMRAAAALAGLVVLSVLFVRTLILPENVYAIVETGSIYRVVEGKTQAVGVGEKIGAGTHVRTDGDGGAVLKLSDGARIEMHAKSEVLLEQVTDGWSIQLNDGSVSVTPAKQPAGNLYVQNREVTMPVTGAAVWSAAAPIEAEPTFEEASIRRSLAPVYSGPRGGGASPGTLAEPVLSEAASTPRASVQDPFHFMTDYDSKTLLTLTGKITRVDWTNPLVHIYIDVADAGGKVTAWSLVGFPPNKLKRDGFPRQLLNIGDTVTITVHKAKDGSNTAAMREVTFPDGSKKFAGPVGQ